jgi:glycosyltransferase involved in cell wall biosynthesis
LVQAGVEVEVFTTDAGGCLPQSECAGGVTVRRFPVWAPNDAYYVSPWHFLGLARRARDFDLIHAHSYQALTCLNAALAAGDDRPFVFTPHYHGRGETRVRDILHFPWRVLGAWVFGRAERVICVSSAEVTRLRQRFPRARPVIIPNGVRVSGPGTADSEPPDGKGGRTVLYVGRLERYKNVDRIIAGASYLPEDCRIVILGDGRHKGNLLQQIDRKGLGQRVEIKSELSDEEVLRWYQTCDVCVNLSGSEAFGITLLEALAAGKPVVATDIPAFREISRLSPLVHLVDLRTLKGAGLAEALALAMEQRHSPPDLAAYGWDEVARRTLGVYREVLGREAA